MASKPNTTKRRQPGRKAADIRLVWKEQAPEALFAGKTLAELEAAIGAVEAANEDLKVKEQARSAAVKMRGEKVKSLATMLRTVVRGVQGHPDHGEDSPLYRAMGFVPFSERSSGLRRRSKTGTGNAGNNEAAA